MSFPSGPGLATPAGALNRPELRLCHLLTWSRYDGYGFSVLHNNDGVFVKDVEPNSPAQTGGLRFNDRILEINGKKVKGYRDRKYIMKEIDKYKTARGNAIGGGRPTYLDLLVADDFSYNYYKSKKIKDLSTKNRKNLTIREIFTPNEQPLVNPIPPIVNPPINTPINPSNFILKNITMRKIIGRENEQLGFEMTKMPNSAHYVTKVEPNSVASLSGLAIDDYLIELNGKPIHSDENTVLRDKILNSMQPANGGKLEFLTINKQAYDYCIQNKIPFSDFIRNNKNSIKYFETPSNLTTPAKPAPVVIPAPLPPPPVIQAPEPTKPSSVVPLPVKIDRTYYRETTTSSSPSYSYNTFDGYRYDRDPSPVNNYGYFRSDSPLSSVIAGRPMLNDDYRDRYIRSDSPVTLSRRPPPMIDNNYMTRSYNNLSRFNDDDDFYRDADNRFSSYNKLNRSTSSNLDTIPYKNSYYTSSGPNTYRAGEGGFGDPYSTTSIFTRSKIDIVSFF